MSKATDDSFKKILVKHLSQSITLVIALAWNSAVKQIISEIPVLKSLGLVIYALILTVLGVITIRILNNADYFLEQTMKMK